MNAKESYLYTFIIIVSFLLINTLRAEEVTQTVSGELEVYYEDHPDGSHNLKHFLLSDQGERIELQLDKKSKNLKNGTRVLAKGLLLQKEDKLPSGSVRKLITNEDNILELAIDAGNDGGSNGGYIPRLPNTLGEQKTLVLMINFQDQPETLPWSIDEVSQAVFKDTSDYFFENSFGQTWLTGKVLGPYTIELGSDVCDIQTMKSLSNSFAINEGINLGDYQRIAYFHPRNACRWAGVATVGGNGATAVMNGTIDPRVVGHELGHTLGLMHAHGLECQTQTLSENCTNSEYADPFDIMGQRISHFNSFHKERLGWIKQSEFLEVTTSGTYTLTPYTNSGSSTSRVLKVLRNTDQTTGNSSWFYLEYRTATGIDSWLAENTNANNSVIVHLAVENNANSSNLLDMTPGSDLIFDWFDAGLSKDSTFTDPLSGITLTTLNISDESAIVSVEFTNSENPEVKTNSNPLAQDDNAITNEGVPVSISVLANDSDPDEDSLSIVSASSSQGTTVINSIGTITFTPTNGFIGDAVVDYSISDGNGGTASASVHITVQELPDTINPTVTILSPSNGEVVSSGQQVIISADAQDNKGIRKVEFIINETVLFTDTTTPYSFTYQIPKGKEKTFNIVVRATDTSNLQGSASLTIGKSDTTETGQGGGKGSGKGGKK